jgi:isoleucyl-tRNA synthetase
MMKDYKNSIYLPKTDFPMKGGLPELEPKLLQRWNDMGLYQKLRDDRKDKEKFLLHDGPPYANGHLHIGHALNKILKDIINRSQLMLGKDVPFVPGWDCHGLPIEWKIEEQYRAKGLDKDDIDPLKFREECRKFAQGWIEIQKKEFERLGLLGDWNNPYTTMAYHAEACIVEELNKFVMNGALYRGSRPVMWSVVEKTALAEAEIEYHDHKSDTIWVKFLIREAEYQSLVGAYIVIWTTTPWTIPANRALAFGPDLGYGCYEVKAVSEDSLSKVGDRLILSETLAEQVLKEAKVTDYSLLERLTTDKLQAIVAEHPLKNHQAADQGYDFDVPLFTGDFVTNDAGTGFVHIAPGHGEEDWKLGRVYSIPIPETVLPDGTYHSNIAIFAGLPVLAQGKNGAYYSPISATIKESLRHCDRLLHHGKITHSYPHSWRSKAPLIYRTTAQWFISMETNELRKTALSEIEKIRFIPEQGRNRLSSMVRSRPDWCISRQRSWGVPITVFVHKDTGELLRDKNVIDRIIRSIENDGADAWYKNPSSYFLGSDYKEIEWEKVTDILDVWFDSGSTHSFVMENGPWHLTSPASLYLEGSDQHRGWFQSSLLESCGTRQKAPFKAILTHGFVLDDQGRKMSKSLGNVVSPQEIVENYGADILRLWVASSDYSDDLRIGKEIIQTQIDSYRRIRNSLRYLLGALEGFKESDRCALHHMPQLERWVLHRLYQMNKMVHQAAEAYEFHGLFTEILNFCSVDLSAFYFDIRKDSLYCDYEFDSRRLAARTVMDYVFTCLTSWLAPLLCFTTEEAFLARYKTTNTSIHQQNYPVIPEEFYDKKLYDRWVRVREIRRVITGALEKERIEKVIGSSLQAFPHLYVHQDDLAILAGIDMAEISITSDLKIIEGDGPDDAFRLPDVKGVSVLFKLANGEKCQRCWKIYTLANQSSSEQEPLCQRCSDVIKHQEKGEICV